MPNDKVSKTDPLINEAIKVVAQYDRASASLIQRKLSINYAQAARILETLESMGIVGPTKGSEPRDVLVRNADEYFQSTGNFDAINPNNSVPQSLDPLIEESVKIVCQYDAVSASLLQRKLSIGYARAARMLDYLTEIKFIGPGEGSKPRTVLIKTQSEALEKLKTVQGNLNNVNSSPQDGKSMIAEKLPPRLVKMEAAIIEKTLESFNIIARVVEINTPKFETEFCMEIALGTNISDIIKHDKDLALALASPSGTVRIEAPIPGRSLIGITVPNPKDADAKRWENEPEKLEENNKLTWRKYVAGLCYFSSNVLKNWGNKYYYYQPVKK